MDGVTEDVKAGEHDFGVGMVGVMEGLKLLVLAVVSYRQLLGLTCVVDDMAEKIEHQLVYEFVI